MTSPTEPTGDATPRPAMPDLSDLIADPGKPPRPRNPRNRTYAVAAAGGLVLLGAGFGVGYGVAPHGPKTLTAAVQQAEAGKLPCGTPSTTTVAGGGGFGGGAGGTGGAATFLVARLCQNAQSNGGTGGFTPGANGGGGFARGGAGGFGGLFGPGSVNGTITSLTSSSITLQTRAGTVTVALPASAKISKTTAGSVKDLGSGERVVVSTTQDGSGNRTATSIFVLPATTTAQAG